MLIMLSGSQLPLSFNFGCPAVVKSGEKMSEVKLTRIKQYLGEVHVKVECDFVYYNLKDDAEKIKTAFEETMAKFAI